MPMQRSRYPADWEAISRRIRDREGWRCKWCGVAHGAERISVRSGKPYRVVLTVAHLDHEPSHCADENLAALCQRCHLRHDAQQHARNAARTRRCRTLDAGQGELFVAANMAESERK